MNRLKRTSKGHRASRLLTELGFTHEQVDRPWNEWPAISEQQAPDYLESDQSQAQHSAGISSIVDMATVKQHSLVTTWGPSNTEHMNIFCWGNEKVRTSPLRQNLSPAQDPTKQEVMLHILDITVLRLPLSHPGFWNLLTKLIGSPICTWIKIF